MKDEIRESVLRMTKAAPWLCLVAVAVISATFAYNKLYLLAVLFAPVMGLLAFSATLGYWRTSKSVYANFVPAIFIILSINTSRAGLLWGFPQSFAVALLFMLLPLLVFRRPIANWLAQSAT